MPRNRKKKRGGGGVGHVPVTGLEAAGPRDVAEHDTTERERALTKLWSRLLAAGSKKKERFRDLARKVDAYFANTDTKQGHLFTRPEVAQWASLEGVVAVPVNMAFQVRGWLGPELYHRNPTRQVTVRTKDTVLAAMATVVGKYLNYTPNETHLNNESRAAIDEALLAGRGCQYTGVDPETGLVTSWFVSIDDVLIDPDARRIEDAEWIAWRRRVPLWRVKKEYPETAAGLDRGDYLSESRRACLDIDEEERKKEGQADDDPVYTGGATNDLVTVWEVYSKMGSGFRARDVAKEHRGFDEGTLFRKICFTPGYERPLYEGPWEVPLYLDRAWPFTFLDLTPERNQLWPTSLMAAAMPHNDAASLLSTIAMAKAKEHARTLYGVAAHLDDDKLNRIVRGGLSEVIKLDPTDMATRIDELMSKFEGGEISPEILNERQFHLEQFGQVTGLMPIMKGEVSEQQIRSATEADVRDKNARTRISDMSERVEDWASRVARLEGLLVRLELEADEVQGVLGEPEDTDLGYLIAMSYLGVEIPVRLRTGDPNDLDLETIAPQAACYFDDPQEAIRVALELGLAMPYLNADRVEQGLAPVMFDGLDVRPVTVADVWRDTSYLSAEAICRELAFRVEAGSTKRPDPNKAITEADTLMNVVGQPALQAAGPAIQQLSMADPAAMVEVYNRVLRSVFEAGQVPERQRVYFPKPPPQALMQGERPEGAQEGAGAKDGQPPPKASGPSSRGSGYSYAGGPGQINSPKLSLSGAGKN